MPPVDHFLFFVLFPLTIKKDIAMESILQEYNEITTALEDITTLTGVLGIAKNSYTRSASVCDFITKKASYISESLNMGPVYYGYNYSEEAILKSIGEFISNLFEKIIGFFKNVINHIVRFFGGSTSEGTSSKDIDKSKKEAEELKKEEEETTALATDTEAVKSIHLHITQDAAKKFVTSLGSSTEEMIQRLNQHAANIKHMATAHKVHEHSHISKEIESIEENTKKIVEGLKKHIYADGTLPMYLTYHDGRKYIQSANLNEVLSAIESMKDHNDYANLSTYIDALKDKVLEYTKVLENAKDPQSIKHRLEALIPSIKQEVNGAIKSYINSLGKTLKSDSFTFEGAHSNVVKAHLINNFPGATATVEFGPISIDKGDTMVSNRTPYVVNTIKNTNHIKSEIKGTVDVNPLSFNGMHMFKLFHSIGIPVIYNHTSAKNAKEVIEKIQADTDTQRKAFPAAMSAGNMGDNYSFALTLLNCWSKYAMNIARFIVAELEANKTGIKLLDSYMRDMKKLRDEYISLAKAYVKLSAAISKESEKN